MPKILLERLTEDTQPPPDVAGRRVIIDVPDLPVNVTTLDAAIEYVIKNPDVLPVKILRTLELYRGHPLARKPQ